VSTPWLWVPAALLAAVFLGMGFRLGAPRAGAWAALAIVGQGSALALIKAGPLVGYQHYRGMSEALRDRPIALSLATLVVGIAVLGLVRQRREMGTWIRARGRSWQVIFAIIVGSALAAAPSAIGWARELLLAATLQLAALLCVLFAVAHLPADWSARVDRWIARQLELPATRPRLDRFAWLLAGFVTLVAAVLSLTSYQAIPHIPDEIAYLLQARYFAEGLPWMTPPPVPAAFDTFLLEVSGDRWYGVFPPGWPLVLAAGVKLGAPFLMNPVLGGVCVLLTYLLVQELADRATARVTTFLLAVSPWHLLMSMSFMSHVLSLALALLTAWGTARAWRTGGWTPALIAGLSLGILGMSRPLEGVAVGLVAGVPLLVAAFRRGHVGSLLSGAIGTAVTGGLGLAYNKVITGAPFVFPAERLFERAYGAERYTIGFGPEKGLGWTGVDPFPGHGPVDVVVNATLNGFMLNVDLFGWAVGSVAIVTLGFLRADRAIERVMGLTIVVVVALHSAFWFSGGPDFGARYWYLTIVPCAVLAGRALASIEARHTVMPGARTMVATGILCLGALFLHVPWRAADKYRHYRSIRPDFVMMRDNPTYRDGLILVSGRRHPEWAAAAIANDTRIGSSSSPVFAWDRDPATRQAVLNAFPSRPVWLMKGPSETGGFEILRGPIAPSERQSLQQP
jgi:4-amino-4-deoxy-L-arabinose transferase-like glycosyltransferase